MKTYPSGTKLDLTSFRHLTHASPRCPHICLLHVALFLVLCPFNCFSSWVFRDFDCPISLTNRWQMLKIENSRLCVQSVKGDPLPLLWGVPWELTLLRFFRSWQAVAIPLSFFSQDLTFLSRQSHICIFLTTLAQGNGKTQPTPLTWLSVGQHQWYMDVDVPY